MKPLELTLHKRQGLAMMAPAEEILYGGAAGGGKSHLMRVAFSTWCMAVPGLQCAIFRRTYPELKMNHLEGPGSFHEMLAPLVKAGKCRIVDKDVKFSNGSMIGLRHLQHHKDLTNYQGAQFHALGLDEATHFTEEEYRYLRARCRVTGLNLPPDLPWIFPRILLGTNPGGRGHHWCKSGFVDKGPYRVHKAGKEDGGMRRVYIPARLEDNPSLTLADPTYVERLEGLGDPLLVRALKEGDWDVVAGSMYGEVWRRPRHVVQPFPIPPDWPIWLGGDDGFDQPSCIAWLTQDPQRKTYYAIAELYQSKLHPDDLAMAMVDVHRRIKIKGRRGDSEPVPNEAKIDGLYDSAAFADKGESRRGGRGDQINAALRHLQAGQLRPVDKWQGSRVHRAQNLHRMLADNKDDPAGFPGIRFFDGACPNLIRTIPTLSRDAKNPEDVDTNEEDHPYDALTYGLQWRSNKVIKRRVGGL